MASSSLRPPHASEYHIFITRPYPMPLLVRFSYDFALPYRFHPHEQYPLPHCCPIVLPVQFRTQRTRRPFHAASSCREIYTLQSWLKLDEPLLHLKSVLPINRSLIAIIRIRFRLPCTSPTRVTTKCFA